MTYDHTGTPKHSNEREEFSGSNLAQHNGCRRLEKHIWDEEDEGDETVSSTNQVQTFGHAI